MANIAIKENESENEDEDRLTIFSKTLKSCSSVPQKLKPTIAKQVLKINVSHALVSNGMMRFKRQREIDGRPCLTINKLPAYIRQVVNDSRQNKPAIKCHPVDSESDTDTAEILNGLIRNIEYTSNADIAYDTALEDAVTMGFGYWRVNIEHAHDDTFDMDLCIERVANPFSVYADPDSDCADSSDWNCAFVTELVTKDEFERRWKGKEPTNWDSYEYLAEPWIDSEKILVCEYWERKPSNKTIVQLSDGTVLDEDAYKEHQEIYDVLGITVTNSRVVESHKVMQHILTGAEVLESKEWSGRYIPIVPVYGDEVNIEGKRYFRSLIRDAKDSQRQFNFWRTNATEMMALAPRTPFIGKKGAFNSDIEKWNTANVKNHPFIEYDGIEPPMRQPFPQPPVGMIQEAMNAADDIKSIIGIF